MHSVFNFSSSSLTCVSFFVRWFICRLWSNTHNLMPQLMQSQNVLLLFDYTVWLNLVSIYFKAKICHFWFQINTAIKFLQNPKVMTSPLYQKKAFLEKKGNLWIENLSLLRNDKSFDVKEKEKQSKIKYFMKI